MRKLGRKTDEKCSAKTLKNFIFNFPVCYFLVFERDDFVNDWSFRKRRTQRRSPVSIPVPVLDLDEEESSREGIDSVLISAILFGF